MSTAPLSWLEPDWPAPANVRAAVSLRAGGVSEGPYASLNLAAHVGDDPAVVAENRRRLRAALALPAEPLWLDQVHGNVVAEADQARNAVPAGPVAIAPPTADAAVAHSPGQVCVVLTADCLPVLICDRHGTHVAAAHAGWRGLAGGVLDATVAALVSTERVSERATERTTGRTTGRTRPAELIAWLGPAIEPEAFEVGDEVREAFLARDRAHETAFSRNARGRWQADLYRLARRELLRLGVGEVHGGGFRCHADRERFYSYRRDGRTGRMASLIWLQRTVP